MKIGFLGLGIMGSRMAANLLAAGHEVTVWNRTAEPVEQLAAKGARQAASPSEALQGAECGIAMLTGPEAVDSVLFDMPDAVAALEGNIFVNMSSVAPEYSRDLSERLLARGVSFVDAPVSGSRKPAEDGSLVILAGGEESVIDRLQPVFDAMGSRTVRCGVAGQGSMMKMAVNLLLGIMMGGFAEMMHFGEKGGLSRESLLEVVLNGPMSNVLYQLKKDMFATGDFPAQFPLMHMNKDIRFILQTAKESGAEVPLGSVAANMYAQGMSAGLSDEDFAAVFKILGS